MVFKTRSCRWWRGRGLVDVFGLSYLDSSVRIALPGVFQQSSVAVLSGVVVGGVGLDPHRQHAIGWVLPPETANVSRHPVPLSWVLNSLSSLQERSYFHVPLLAFNLIPNVSSSARTLSMVGRSLEFIVVSLFI